MNPDSDEIIISGIRNREDNAFKYLQVKFKGSIRLMVLESGGTEEDARDVFSDGIVALIRIVDRADFKLTCKLGTLVYAICNKTWKHHLERKIVVGKYQYMRTEDQPESDFSEAQDAELYKDIFWDCFNQLEQFCREILSAYLHEVSIQEFSELTGRSCAYIRNKKSRCHGYLMKMIENHPDFRKIMNEQETITT